ncbi:transglutaminase family protein [Haloferula chungangensis]|uniref:Transglutaminase family protein n=1 Tax=Haloferula chungangensis TaxID=1048331 RepID=A0ABW2LAL1_9BACT
MKGPLPTAESLAVLLRLIDDETPEVRQSVAGALDAFSGDVSELLHEGVMKPSGDDLKVLSSLLQPARRERLRRDWIVPAGGAASLADDWDAFEAMLRILSDYLHDGVTLRQPLGDALDLLAEELEPHYIEDGCAGLCKTLLGSKRLIADRKGEMDPKLLDLAAVIAGSPSNSFGLGLILLLVARRLEADISGVSLPGAFFCRYGTEQGPILLDPTAGGRPVDPAEFTHRIRRYPREIRMLAGRAATTGELLLRTTEELATAFAVLNLTEDAELMEDLVDSLLPGA